MNYSIQEALRVVFVLVWRLNSVLNSLHAYATLNTAKTCTNCDDLGSVSPHPGT